MISTLSCHSELQSHTDNGQHGAGCGCLNFAYQISRELPNGIQSQQNSPSVKMSVQFYKSPILSKMHTLWSNSDNNNNNFIVYRFSTIIHSTETIHSPPVVTSGILLCFGHNKNDANRSDKNSQTNTFHSYLIDSTVEPIIVCNNAAEIHILTTVETDKNTVTPSEQTIKNLQNKGDKTIENALIKGLNAIKRDHIAYHSKIMSTVDFQLSTTNNLEVTDSKYAQTTSSKLKVCENNLMTNRLSNFNKGCLLSQNTVQSYSQTASAHRVNDKSELKQQQSVVDVALVTKLYQFGRYLALSSGYLMFVFAFLLLYCCDIDCKFHRCNV